MVSYANFRTAFNIQGGAGGSGVTAFYDTDDIVYRKSDFTQPPGADRSLNKYAYRIIALELNTFNDNGEEKYSQLTKTVGATCAGKPYLVPTDQLDDTTTPFFYRIQRVIDSQYTDLVHESDLYTQDLIISYIQTNLPNWWTS